MRGLDPEIFAPAHTVWDYLKIDDPLEKADGILCFGSSDLRVAEWAARYHLDGWAPWILFSGNVGRLTEGRFTDSEAVLFAARARELGVPDSAMKLEARSRNSGENVRFSKECAEQLGLVSGTFIVVQKPYMGRRALATMQRFWPEARCVMRSWDVSLTEYLESSPSAEEVIHLMVGDLQRMKVYPPLGYQAPVEIPVPVWAAFETLVELGFTDHVVK